MSQMPVRRLPGAWPLMAAGLLLAVVAVASLGGTGTRLGSRSLGIHARFGAAGPCPDPTGSPAAGSPARGSAAAGGALVPVSPVAGAAAGPAGPPAPAASASACVPPERKIAYGSGGDYKLIQVLFSGVGILGALVLVALVVALFVGLGSAVGSIRVRRRPRARAVAVLDDSLGDARATSSAARLGEAVEAGLVDLEEGDPRRAVIAAWRRLEIAAADAGTARSPAETPAELTTRVLSAHAVSPVTLTRLADLYREARYSRHQVDERHRVEARRALERLRTELTAAVTT